MTQAARPALKPTMAPPSRGGSAKPGVSQRQPSHRKEPHMNRNASALLAPLHPEVESVLATMTADGPDVSLKLNDLCGRTGLPTGHVGRHLRTLERDRLVRYSAGA